MVTYFSPSFARAVTYFEGVDFSCPLPLDLPGPCATFLNRVKPLRLLIARTDLWPEMLEQCRVRNIPVEIFSYTQKPFGSVIKRNFTRIMFEWIENVYCVSEADRALLAASRTRATIQVMGDTRYDQVAYRLGHAQTLDSIFRPADSDPPILVAGSTWDEDEEELLTAAHELIKNKELKLIVVPHEPSPEHLIRLESRIAHFHLSSRRMSEGKAWSDRQILIVDRVGVLAELYRWGSLAFVGGSFRGSVHSVMEALGAGAITFVGPDHGNNREAITFKGLMIAGEPGLRVVNRFDFGNQLTHALATRARWSEVSGGLLKEFWRAVRCEPAAG